MSIVYAKENQGKSGCAVIGLAGHGTVSGASRAFTASYTECSNMKLEANARAGNKSITRGLGKVLSLEQ